MIFTANQHHVSTLHCVMSHVWLPGQVLQHFPADFRGCWHGYWLGHVMRLQSWRPSVQVHRMHSRTFPKTGCHMSPWEYVLPLYKHAGRNGKHLSVALATYGNDREVARNMSIKSPKNTYAGSFVSPFWCFLCNKIFTVVSEAPLRLSLLRLRPLGEVLTFIGVARSDSALLCSPEHWSTECLFCKHRYNKTVIIYIFIQLLALLAFPPRDHYHESLPTSHIYFSNSNRQTLQFNLIIRPSGSWGKIWSLCV